MLIRSEWDLSPVYLTRSISYRYRDGRLSCAHWISKFRLFWLFEIGFNQPLVAAVYWLAGVAQTASDRCDWATNNMSLIDISGSVNWLTIRQSNNIRLHMVKHNVFEKVPKWDQSSNNYWIHNPIYSCLLIAVTSARFIFSWEQSRNLDSITILAIKAQQNSVWLLCM